MFFYAIGLLVFHCMLFFSFRHGQNLFCTQLSYWANAKINKDSALLPKKTFFFHQNVKSCLLRGKQQYLGQIWI